MADEIIKDDKKTTVEVPQETLSKIMEDIAQLQKDNADKDAKIAALSDGGEAKPVGQTPLREKKTFEPAFRVVRLKKLPFNGDPEDKRIVIGWTDRGSYQKVDRSGTHAELVDYMQVIYLGHERDKDGKLQAFEVKTLDLYNAESIVCKIINEDVKKTKDPTGEVIPVTTYDPKHGTVLTGDTVDGWVENAEVKLTISVPGVIEPVTINAKYANICG